MKKLGRNHTQCVASIIGFIYGPEEELRYLKNNDNDGY